MIDKLIKNGIESLKTKNNKAEVFLGDVKIIDNEILVMLYSVVVNDNNQLAGGDTEVVSLSEESLGDFIRENLL
jgi:hypothetical protein